MKRSLLVLWVIACLGLAGGSPTFACGDKIVDISQGVKFQRALAMRTATILIYVDADQLKRPVKRLRANLARVGHDVELVSDRKVAIDALHNGEYDLVIAELSELVMMESILDSGSSPPHAIPFVLDGTDADLERAREAHPYVLALPGKDNEQILTVEEALIAHQPVASTT